MVQFSDLNLPVFLTEKLAQMGYKKPTEIQEKSIPVVLNGKDILASSQTGSGKTGAFVIPIITKIINNPDSAALILVPTRELALQIKEVIHEMRCNERIHTALIFGGTAIDAQIFALKKNPKIVIATPGRLQDHLQRKTANLAKFDILVLDEFDRMLDMGFRDDISNIVRHLPQNRQTLMFSATKRASIINHAKLYLKDFVEVNIEQPKETHENIQQKFIELREEEKYPHLIKEISEREGSIIIFVNMKRVADDLCAWLRKDGIEAQAVHGDLRQRQRENTVKRFRDEKFQVLIATDVVARGIDIPHIKHVVNYDTPRTFEDYTHRIGRTGRGGADGYSICFVTRSEKSFYNNILKQINSDDSEPVYNQRRGVHGGRPSSSRNDRRSSTPRREYSKDGNRERPQGKPFGRNRNDNSFGAEGNSDRRNSGSTFKKDERGNSERKEYTPRSGGYKSGNERPTSNFGDRRKKW